MTTPESPALLANRGADDEGPRLREETGPFRAGVDYATMTASTSRAESTSRSSPEYFTSVPPYFE